MPTVKSLPTLFIQAILVAAVSVGALLLASRYLTPIPLSVSQVTTAKSSDFSVSGKSTITTQPDLAEITLGVSQKAANLKQAQDSANNIMQQIQASLSNLGIKPEDIKTQNYSIYPTYDYQNGNGQRIVGYSIDISLLVDLKQENFDKLNNVIDSATAAGANQVGNVQFKLSDTKERAVRKQAREEAIKDAEANAQELSSLSGMHLGKIINVTEEPNQPIIRPMMFDSKAVGAGEAQANSTNIQPGSTTYNYTVTISYETL